jgi:hypothetical protein
MNRFLDIENGLNSSSFSEIDVSIILKDKSLDNPPYLKIN